VPAAAVIRRPQTLSGIIGRKEMRRRFDKFVVKAPGLTRENAAKTVRIEWGQGD
jgi:hypothetical protein